MPACCGASRDAVSCGGSDSPRVVVAGPFPGNDGQARGAATTIEIVAGTCRHIPARRWAMLSNLLLRQMRHAISEYPSAEGLWACACRLPIISPQPARWRSIRRRSSPASRRHCTCLPRIWSITVTTLWWNHLAVRASESAPPPARRAVRRTDRCGRAVYARTTTRADAVGVRHAVAPVSARLRHVDGPAPRLAGLGRARRSLCDRRRLRRRFRLRQRAATAAHGAHGARSGARGLRRIVLEGARARLATRIHGMPAMASRRHRASQGAAELRMSLARAGRACATDRVWRLQSAPVSAAPSVSLCKAGPT